MKSRFIKSVLLTIVIVGGIWVLSNRDQIDKPGDVVALIQKKLKATPIGYSAPSTVPPYQNRTTAIVQPTQIVNNVVRIASFKLNENVTGPQSDQSIELIADICRRFDAIAFQEIDGRDNSWLQRLTDRMNVMGAVGVNRSTAVGKRKSKADYFFVSDLSQNPGDSTRAAIVFNRQTLELDPLHYNVNDPDDVLSREPMVAWFRARGTRSPEDAFTFNLVNVKIDAGRTNSELAYLSGLFRAIREDGRGEDDILMVGNFNAGDRALQPMRKQAGLTWVVSNRPTDTRNTSQFDNLIFNDVATVEFTGRGGVFDFMRHYNLRLDDALNISDHMPVWAEFSIFEGAASGARVSPSRTPGRVANGVHPSTRK